MSTQAAREVAYAHVYHDFENVELTAEQDAAAEPFLNAVAATWDSLEGVEDAESRFAWAFDEAPLDQVAYDAWRAEVAP